METGYYFMFITGLLGGAGHCIGMCGPIVASYTFYDSATQYGQFARLVAPHILYNAGRIITYSLIGAVMGFAGSAASVAGKMSGLQHTMPIVTGTIMIIMGISVTGIFGNLSWLESKNNFILNVGRRISMVNSVWKFFPLGLLLGFLPCGLSYTAFVAAAGTGGVFSGFMISLLFGIGTVPSLLLFGIATSYISTRIRGLLYRAAGVLVIILGMLFVLRGIRFYV